MIETSQYCLDITVGEKGTAEYRENFLTPEDFLYFKMYKLCGAVPPYFKVSFKVKTAKISKEDISMLFKQGSIVHLVIGPDKLHLKSYTLSIGEVDISQADTNDAVRFVKFDAVIEKTIPYLTNHKQDSFTGNSLEAIRQFGKKYFGTELVTDIGDVQEVSYDRVNKDTKNLLTKKYWQVKETPMTWQQQGNAPNMFLTSIWLHSNIQPDVPILYIDDTLTIHYKSYNKIIGGETKYIFTPRQPEQGKNQIQFYNSFNPQAHKLLFNLLGKEKLSFIREADSGRISVYKPNITKSSLAVTKKIENTNGGENEALNSVEGPNTYKGYKWTYQANRAMLNYLSGVSGYVTLIGLRDDIELLTLAEVQNVSDADNGKYIIFDIQYEVTHGSNFLTHVFLCRDNTNNLESCILRQTNQNPYDILKNEIQKYYEFVRNLRKYAVMARYMIDGSLYRDIIKFATNLKTNLLKSFTVLGISLDFNSTDDLVKSLTGIGNSLINNIVRDYLPHPFNQVLQNFALQDPNLATLVTKLLSQYAPSDTRYLITEITGILTDITSGLNRVAKSASVAQKSMSVNLGYMSGAETAFKDTTQGVVEVVTKESEQMNIEQQTQKRVDDIIQEFIDNTKDLDLPMPIIELTEEERLLNDIDLKNLLAQRVMAELESKGYLTGVNAAVQNDNNSDTATFEDILLGSAQVGFSTINQVQDNVGLTLYSRYYGIFTDPTQLTDFYIKDQFRDMYKTVEFQRLISAKQGERIFVALPMREENLTFFINSTVQQMEVIPYMDLGIRTVSGTPVYYNVYMSPLGYNSNSNLLEVRA